MLATKSFDRESAVACAPKPSTPGIQDHVTECHELLTHTDKFIADLYERLRPVLRCVDSVTSVPTPPVGAPGDSDIAERLCELRQRLINLNGGVHRITNLLDL